MADTFLEQFGELHPLHRTALDGPIQVVLELDVEAVLASDDLHRGVVIDLGEGNAVDAGLVFGILGIVVVLPVDFRDVVEIVDARNALEGESADARCGRGACLFLFLIGWLGLREVRAGNEAGDQ